VDGATEKDRQVYVFDKVIEVLNANFKQKNKEDARRLIQEFRQLFIDWNYVKMDSKEFKELEKKIDAKIAENV
jgi:hypothetical protein